GTGLVGTRLVGDRLVGDLGGTHLRLGLHADGRLRRTAVHRWASSPSLLETVQGFLGDDNPVAGCFAVAAPVEGSRVTLTNAKVSFCADELRTALGLDCLHLVNDVAALARSVTELQHDDAVELGGGPLRLDRPVVVVAPGTGLGVAALLPTQHGPVVVDGEGGHIPLPATVLGLPVAQAMLRLQEHVSAEDLLCGGSLTVLDVVVRALHGELRPTPRTAADVTSSCDADVLEVFVELLAAVVQSHALTVGARGGVVLGGGFVRELVPILREFGFRERFARHGKMADYLTAIPVVVDTRDHPALVGAASFLEDLA
ncbi:MAG: glucokinase, partial [Mycobacteriales bacterium]